ncbi:hypothetical protein OG453_41695 [Streptomyces sp. NBC_01381]|nr:hypothetical protein [Streptomyces sp. NBC_01381]
MVDHDAAPLGFRVQDAVQDGSRDADQRRPLGTDQARQPDLARGLALPVHMRDHAHAEALDQTCVRETQLVQRPQ